MDRKTSIIALLAMSLALVSAGFMTGAIKFTAMPGLYQEYMSGSITDTNYTLHSWDLEVVDADDFSIYLNGTGSFTQDYTFEVMILDAGGSPIVNATRVIGLVAGVPSNEQFYFATSNRTADFSGISIEIKR